MMDNEESSELYYPMLTKFRTQLIEEKKKSKQHKYKEMYHFLSRLKGCNCLLISVRGLLIETTLANKTTADYINYNFWGMSVRARKFLRDMDSDDDLSCIRMTTSFYECIISIGGTVDESDFMIFFTQTMPYSKKRPMCNIGKIEAMETVADAVSTDEEKDPISSMRKAMAELAERIPESGLSMYEMKKMSFLSKASSMQIMKPKMTSQSRTSGIGREASSMSLREESFTVHSLTKPSYASEFLVPSKQRMSMMSAMSQSLQSETESAVSKGATKWSSTMGSTKTDSKQAISKGRRTKELRKEKYDWIKIDKDDMMNPPDAAPLYRRSSTTLSDHDDDIGYWRKWPERKFPIFDEDGSVLQDEVTIGFKPCSGDQFPPRKFVSKKMKREMVFKKKNTTATPGSSKPA